MAGGWARFEGAWQPYFATVSNFHRDGEELTSATEVFTVEFTRLEEGETGVLLHVGQAVPDETREALRVQLRGAVEQEDRAAVLDALVDAMRSIAKNNELVGRGLLVNVMPRDVVNSPHTTLTGGLLSPTGSAFFYVSHDDQRGEMYGPIVIGGGSVVSDLTFRELAEGEHPFQTG